MASAFTVFFDGSLWMGVLEVTDDSGAVRAARHVFGAEPSDAELWEFIATYANSLFDRAFAAPAVEASERRQRWRQRAQGATSRGGQAPGVRGLVEQHVDLGSGSSGPARRTRQDGR